MPDPMLDWSDKLGLSRDDAAELMDKAIVIASKVDIRVQNMANDHCKHGQELNEDIVRMMTLAIAMSWSIEDATDEWGWRTEGFAPFELAGVLLRTAMEYTLTHRRPYEATDHGSDHG